MLDYRPITVAKATLGVALLIAAGAMLVDGGPGTGAVLGALLLCALLLVLRDRRY